MDRDKLRSAYAAKVKAAQTLADQFKGQDMPAETANQITALLGESDAIRAQLDIAEKLEKGIEYLGEHDEPQAASLAWREAAPGEGDAPVDEKGWRETEITLPGGEKRYVRFNVPLGVQGKGYEPAFEAYLRKGRNELGPNDRKALTEGVDSAGGFLVPETVLTMITKKIATAATVRPNARVISISSDTVTWPKIHYTTDDKYTSGIRLTWTGETPATSTAHRVTDQVTGDYVVPVNTAMASQLISNQLIEDAAYDVLGQSSELFGEAFALGENNVFWNGTGSGQPHGLLTGVDADGPASVNSGATATLTMDGVIDLSYALPSQYEANAKWYMAKATEKVIRKLKTTNGDYLWPVVANVGNFGPVPRQLLESPVVRDEFLPAVGTGTYPIVFGDMRGYLIVDRVALSIQRLVELYAETNYTCLLARRRVGGQCVEPWRLKIQKVSA